MKIGKEIKLIGEGILHIFEKDLKISLKIVFDKVEEYYEFIGETDELAYSLPFCTFKDFGEVYLKNVSLGYYNKTEDVKNTFLKKDILKNFFLSTIKDGKIFNFVFKEGFIELEMKNPYTNNFIVLGNFKINRNILGFTLENGIEIKKDPYTKNQIIICRDEKIIETEDIKYITLALELFQGQYLMKMEEKIGGKIKFFLGKYKYNSIPTSTFLSDSNYCNDFVEIIYNFLKSLDQKDRSKWERAFRLLISYNSVKNLDGIVQLLQFFDIFKESSSNNNEESFLENKIHELLEQIELSESEKIKAIIKECKNEITQKGKYNKTLKDEFLFTEEEAKFITNIRNDIIHESLFLDESIGKNFRRFQLDNSSRLYRYLSSVTNSIIQGYILATYLEEVIYKYILKKISKLDEEYCKNENKLKDYTDIYEQLKKL